MDEPREMSDDGTGLGQVRRLTRELAAAALEAGRLRATLLTIRNTAQNTHCDLITRLKQVAALVDLALAQEDS